MSSKLRSLSMTSKHMFSYAKGKLLTNSQENIFSPKKLSKKKKKSLIIKKHKLYIV